MTIFAGDNCSASSNDTWILSNIVVPFAAFAAKVDINLASSSFGVNSTFTIGAGWNTTPLTDAVTLQLGGFSITIPGGSFRLVGNGKRFVFSGAVNGVALEANMTPLGGDSYTFRLEGSGASKLHTFDLGDGWPRDRQQHWKHPGQPRF